MYLHLALGLFTFCSSCLAQIDAATGAEEQQRILILVRQYAATYHMPDLAFDRKTLESTGNPRTGKWHKTSASCTSRFAHDGKEYWRKLQDNCHPTAGEKWRKAGTYQGRVLPHVDLFKPLGDGRARWSWDRWDTIESHKAAVFRYTVSLANSEWVLSGGLNSGVSARMPYSGCIFADPATGAIWRMTDDVVDGPEGFPIRTVFDVEDFEEVTIENERYILPTTETTTMKTIDGWRRVVFALSNYRKFEANSSIIYGP